MAVALAERLRGARRGPGRGLGRRAAGLRRAARSLTGVADAPPSARALEHRLRRLPARRRALQRRRSTPSSPTPRSTALLAAGGAPHRGGRDRPLPARRAGRARPAPAAARGRARALDARAARRAGPPALHAELARRGAVGGARGSTPPTATAIVRALELLDAGRARAAARAPHRSCGPPRPGTPRCLAGLAMDREALYARIDARVDAMVAAGAAEEVRRAARRRRVGDRPQGAGLRGAAGRRRRGDEAAHAQLRRAASSRGCASSPGVELDRRDRPPARRPTRCRAASSRRCRRGSPTMLAAMNFEKWQALGNDYLIVEARDAARSSSRPRASARCATPTRASARTASCCSSEPDEPGFVARLRIFNPDGSEAELSGNGAREAILYLRRRGWTDADAFSIQTAAGEIRPAHHRARRPARVDMGRARLRVRATSRAAPTTAPARSSAGGREWRFQHVSIGNPQCAIHVADRRARGARPAARSARAIEHHELFPNRTNVSLVRRARARTHPRADLRARRGGDDVLGHRRDRRRRRRRAARRRLAR